MGNTNSNERRRPEISYEDKCKLESGKPVNFQGGVSIRFNPQTGKLEGMPEEWVKGYDLPVPVDESKMVRTKHFYREIRPQSDLPDSILQLINSQPVPVSKPTNFQHVVHLQVDLNSEFGIKGLPEDWRKMFMKQGISPEDIKKNPVDMVKILEAIETEEVQPENKLLTNEQFNNVVKSIEFKTDNPNDQYRFAGELGKGAMCKVYHVFNRADPSKDFAVRLMKVPDPGTIEKIKIETAVMTMCSNKNIINYHSSYCYKNCLFMFIEFMDGGSLTQIIYQYMKKIDQSVIAYVLREILLGLLPLHEHKQIHRDLKSDNILINKKGQVKVADFGFAIQLTKEKKNRKSVVGTPAWMAPQLIKKENYNEKVDVWSVGVIAVELAEGQPPYLRLPALKAMFFISTKEPYRLNKAKFSPELCSFVEACLEKDTNKRWSVSKLLTHPFIRMIGTGDAQRAKFSQMVQDKKNVSLSELMSNA